MIALFNIFEMFPADNSTTQSVDTIYAIVDFLLYNVHLLRCNVTYCKALLFIIVCVSNGTYKITVT